MKKYKLGYEFKNGLGSFYLYNNKDKIHLIGNLREDEYKDIRKLCKYANKFIKKFKYLNISSTIDYNIECRNDVKLRRYLDESYDAFHSRFNTKNVIKVLPSYDLTDNAGCYVCINSSYNEMHSDLLNNKKYNKNLFTIFHFNGGYRKLIMVTTDRNALIFSYIMNAYYNIDKLNYIDNLLKKKIDDEFSYFMKSKTSK